MVDIDKLIKINIFHTQEKQIPEIDDKHKQKLTETQDTSVPWRKLRSPQVHKNTHLAKIIQAHTHSQFHTKS